MYYTHFGLNYPPYRITPDTRMFYSGADRGEILDALMYAISTGEGITKVVGEVGSGKTMLCRMLEKKLPASVEIVYLANPTIDPKHILHAIAMELGLPVAQDRQADRLQIMKALEHYLVDKHANNKQVIVFVEEAQCMPLETLEEIRLLSNLETQQYKLLQIVLFGQPELDENLSSPHVRQIKDRITNSFYLPPMGIDDIRDYLMFRLRSVGYHGPNIFTRTAALLIARLSKGLVRRINILADKAMLAAYARSASVISGKHVLAAARDSGFGFSFMRGKTALISVVLVTVLATLVLYKHSNIQHWVPLSSAQNIAVVDDKVPEAHLQVPTQRIMQNMPAQDSAAEIAGNIAVNNGDLLQQRLAVSPGWLNRADPQHYSIQLLYSGAESSFAVERFLARESLQDVIPQVYVTRSMANEMVMYNVLYGEFATYSEAKQALTGLSEDLRRYHPYLRNVRDVQAEAIQ